MSLDEILYPSIEPFNHGMLEVSDIHTIYFEECGNPSGFPVVFLHGGPGAGCSTADRRYFDPAFYRIVLFDQRGAGRSKPHACLEDNTTWALVSDIEKVRRHLKIEKWVVFGGSWGSTLSLTYAETHPSSVVALVLRGIFTLRRKELVWFYQEGASFVFPDYWEEYLAPIPEPERFDMMSAYHRRLTGSDPAARDACAAVGAGVAWSKWECATAKLFVDPENVAKAGDPKWALAFARIENHFFVNAGFFKYDGQVINEVDRIRHIPTTIIQGRYDMVCPAVSAWELHRRFPEADLQFVDDAGHSAKELGIATRLVKACDKVRDQLKAGSLTSKMAAASISDTAGAAGAAVSSSTTTTSSSTSYTTYTTSSSSNTATSTTPTRAAGVSSSHQQRLTPQTRFFLG